MHCCVRQKFSPTDVLSSVLDELYIDLLRLYILYAFSEKCAVHGC